MNADEIVENLLGDEPIDPKRIVVGMKERNPNYDFIDIDDLDPFTRAYLAAAYFTDEERLKEELAQNNANNPEFDPEDSPDMEWSQEALESAQADCKNFQVTHSALLELAGDDEQNGHDFWLTRNHHGAGFWDRGYPEEVGDALTKASHSTGEKSAYLGDDGFIYFS
jgi:hypothetical protein